MKSKTYAKITRLTLTFTILFIILFASCSKKPLRVVSGFKSGTYFQIAASLQQVSTIKMSVKDSKGSVENINLIKNNVPLDIPH